MPTVKKQLDKIHRDVLNGFTYRYDQDQYGTPEKWVMPEIGEPVVGDCEDFALACRALCRAAGLKTRLVFCLTEDGGGHCVLACHGWILDNRQVWVKRRDDLRYTWRWISGYKPRDKWHKIK